MPIHWFPGHMATARDEIRRAMPSIDVVIEVLDARIPFSSENPLVAQLRGQTPCIRVLNKADLADPAVTEAWLVALRAAPDVRVFAHQQGAAGLARVVTALAEELAPNVKARARMAMVMGIPNVGKSTFINTLTGRTITKAANKPAVTKMQQRVLVNPQLTLVDTPGFLWPKLSPQVCGYRLGVTGAIAERAVDSRELAGFAGRFLLDRYPEALVARYGLDALPPDEWALLDAVGRRRGFLGKGGVVDQERAATRLLHDVRESAFGRISLERPEDAR